MENTGAVLFLYAESPLHAGSGTGLGAVDLPIQRERMSNLPMIQGSGIKGALRAQLDPGKAAAADARDLHEVLFGPRPPRADGGDPANEYAGAVALVDGRLLLFPVRTVWGGWAWITSPMILERLARDLEILALDRQAVGDAAAAWSRGQAGDGDHVLVTKTSTVARGGRVLIEDLDYEARADAAVDALATWLMQHAVPATAGYQPFADRLSGQLAVVSDAELRFLAEHATEVVTRTRIDEKTGTVADGALWTEESLPAETLLWSTAFVGASRRKGHEATAEKLRDRFVQQVGGCHRIRLGGDRTVGRGLVGLRVFGVSSGKAPDAKAGKGVRS